MRFTRPGDRRAIDVDVEHAHENRHARIVAVGEPFRPAQLGRRRHLGDHRDQAVGRRDDQLARRAAWSAPDRERRPRPRSSARPAASRGMLPVHDRGEQRDAPAIDGIFAAFRVDRGEAPLDGGGRKRAVGLVERWHGACLSGARAQAQRRGCARYGAHPKAPPNPKNRRKANGQDQGEEPGRRARRRRDDPHHLAVDPRAADPALSRRRPASITTCRSRTATRPTTRSRSRPPMRSSSMASASNARRSRPTRRGSRNSASRRCGSRPTARSATSSAACIFREPIVISNVPRLIPGWTDPIVVGRHAFGDQYKATDFLVPGPGKLTMKWVGEDGEELEFEVFDFPGSRRRHGHVQSRRSRSAISPTPASTTASTAAGRSICRPRTPSSRPMTAASRTSSRRFTTANTRRSSRKLASNISIA